jgi:PEGA domain-containing protein
VLGLRPDVVTRKESNSASELDQFPSEAAVVGAARQPIVETGRTHIHAALNRLLSVRPRHVVLPGLSRHAYAVVVLIISAFASGFVVGAATRPAASASQQPNNATANTFALSQLPPPPSLPPALSPLPAPSAPIFGRPPAVVATPAGSRMVVGRPAPARTTAVAATAVKSPAPASARTTPVGARVVKPRSPASARTTPVAARVVKPRTPTFHGSLAVSSRPSGAQVFLNGRSAGRTPLVLNDQAAGSRAVQVALEGYRPWSSVVQIVTGSETRLDATLTQQTEP